MFIYRYVFEKVYAYIYKFEVHMMMLIYFTFYLLVRLGQYMSFSQRPIVKNMTNSYAAKFEIEEEIVQYKLNVQIFDAK